MVDRRAVEVLRQLPERNRFMKGLFAWVGFNAVGVPTSSRHRPGNNSKFNLWRLWNSADAWSASRRALARLVLCRRRRRRRRLRPLHHLRVLIFGIDTPGYASLLIAVLPWRHPAALAQHIGLSRAFVE
jgi:hypothetical protein